MFQCSVSTIFFYFQLRLSDLHAESLANFSLSTPQKYRLLPFGCTAHGKGSMEERVHMLYLREQQTKVACYLSPKISTCLQFLHRTVYSSVSDPLAICPESLSLDSPGRPQDVPARSRGFLSAVSGGRRAWASLFSSLRAPVTGG